MFLMGLCFALFAVIGTDAIANPILITLYCIVLRILQGIASATMQTTCYAIGASDYPKKMHFIVGGIEAVTGGGLILGPLLGSPLHDKYGFRMTFCIAGGSLIFLAAIFAVFFPRS
jgi:MFS family permease